MRRMQGYWNILANSAGSIALAGMLAGCGDAKNGNKTDPSPTLSVPTPSQGSGGDSGGVTSASRTGAAGTAWPSAGRLNQSFSDATVSEPPEGQWLPDITTTGKSVGKLYQMVVSSWSNIPLAANSGKSLAYTAVISTKLGVIEIELWPEIAPNHVRNFIALARAGYYDGLAFDRIIRRDRGPDNGPFEMVEAGCPIGTGESEYGSIGYWLKPEFSAQKLHEAGTVGAVHGEQVESAACKFYITLTSAAWMDGRFTVFGRVSRGLELVRAIQRSRPRADEPDVPDEPIVMQSVSVRSREP